MEKFGMKFSFKEDAKRIVVICAASVIMALNIKTFVRTGGLYPGGATGLTLLIQRVGELFLGFELPYTLINVLLNLVPIYIGFRFIGKKFTLYSCLSIMLTNVLTDVLPSLAITYDTLLISVFGGIFNGLAISMCLMMNATTGGTDFIGIFLSERKGVDSFNVVLGFNAVLLVIAGFLFGPIMRGVFMKSLQGTVITVRRLSKRKAPMSIRSARLSIRSCRGRSARTLSTELERLTPKHLSM